MLVQIFFKDDVVLKLLGKMYQRGSASYLASILNTQMNESKSLSGKFPVNWTLCVHVGL